MDLKNNYIVNQWIWVSSGGKFIRVHCPYQSKLQNIKLTKVYVDVSNSVSLLKCDQTVESHSKSISWSLGSLI